MSVEDVKQAAVDQKRHWVRLTRACNNRCIFCHDCGAHDGQAVPEDVVREKILAGREQGAQRLILSGGEPTIHPKYLDFVAFGREAGYEWIQTVSNGRMFGYNRFAEIAVANGLREITFSMHAHRPELYDRLVGAQGAFAQALKGLRNMVRLGMVVSVDVVLNRLNLPYLREILEFYMSMGVYEYDLLHLVPFGRGFDDFKDELFADEDMLGRELQRALDLADHNDLYIWTNRLPIRYLEGHERYFQDPHKLYDEVLGEREAFRDLFATGKQPDCLGDRCPHCFLRGFCDAARRYAADPAQGEIPAGEELTPARVDALLALPDPDLREAVAEGVRVPTREALPEARAVTPDLAKLRDLAGRSGLPIRGLPPCLGGPQGPAADVRLEPDVLDPDGRIRPDRFVAFFIRNGYTARSLRCRECAFEATCPGLHVNLARIWGLGVLEPRKRAGG